MVNMIEDIMKYYHFNFIPIYCLAAVILLSAVLSFKRGFNKLFLLLFSTIAEIGLLSSMMFTGVLHDNYAPDIFFWSKQLWIILFLSIIGWLIQLIQLIRKK